MRLANTEHTSRPWRIHELIPDFGVEDVWALPTPGGADDFPRLVQAIAAGDPSQGSSRAARTLWAIRWKLGELLGWDDVDAGLGSRVQTLRGRLPADLRDAPSGPEFGSLPFNSLYLLDDEWAAEIANRTVHGVMHIGWVSDGSGGYRGQMAVCVKPNGRLGAAYMAAIRPFRHMIVYPPVMRQIERNWRGGEDRWAVLYDAECGFCKWLLAGLLRWDRAVRLHPIALQRPESGELLAHLTPEQRMASWHLISPTAARFSGGAAVPQLLRLLPGGRVPGAVLARFPRITDRGYRYVAEHRSRLSRCVPASVMRRASRVVSQREQALASPARVP